MCTNPEMNVWIATRCPRRRRRRRLAPPPPPPLTPHRHPRHRKISAPALSSRPVLIGRSQGRSFARRRRRLALVVAGRCPCSPGGAPSLRAPWAAGSGRGAVFLRTTSAPSICRGLSFRSRRMLSRRKLRWALACRQNSRRTAEICR